MERDSIKRFYLIHSWVGALTAVLMFVIAFTGAVSVFGRPDIKIWAHEQLHAQVDLSPSAIEKTLLETASTVPGEYLDDIQIILPGVRRSPYLALVFQNEKINDDESRYTDAIRYDFDPQTLDPIQRRQGEQRELFDTDRKDLADFLITFHADLHLGDPVGLMITGLLGLTLFASVVTGVITHRKILREAFTFRPFRSLRLLFTDSHKVLGVWGLPFHGVIAFTGAFLGLAVVILLPAAAFVSFEGDLDKMVETYLPLDAPSKAGEFAELRVADVIAKARSSDQGPITTIQLLGGEDQNTVALVYTLAGEGIIGETQRYRMTDAALLDRYTQFSRVGGAAGVMLDTMFPLHFGNFGGVLVKYLWFFLGLGTAFLALSGSMIWIERRAYGSAGGLSERTYHRISKLTLGGCTGVVLATMSLFYVQLVILPNVADTGPWLMGSFFGVWGIALLWALARTNVYRAARELLGLAGLGATLLPALSAVMDHGGLSSLAEVGLSPAVMTEATVMALGLVLIYVARRLPDARPVRPKSDRGRLVTVETSNTPVSSAESLTTS